MALVITRRVGEAFTIGDNINVKILATKGPQVKIAIEAPREVNVVRDELKIREKESHGV